MSICCPCCKVSAFCNMSGCCCWGSLWCRKGKFTQRCPAKDTGIDDSYDRYPSLTRRHLNEGGSSCCHQSFVHDEWKNTGDHAERTKCVDINKEIDQTERMSLSRFMTEGKRQAEDEESSLTDSSGGVTGAGKTLRKGLTFDRVRGRSFLLFGKRESMEREESVVHPEMEERLALYRMYGQQLAATGAAPRTATADYHEDPSEGRLRLLRSALQRRRVRFAEGPNFGLVSPGNVETDRHFRRSNISRRKRSGYRTPHVAVCAVMFLIAILQTTAPVAEAFAAGSASLNTEHTVSIFEDSSSDFGEDGICLNPETCRLSSMAFDTSSVKVADEPTPTPPPYSTNPSGPFCGSFDSPSYDSRYSHFMNYYAPIGYLKDVEEVAARELTRFSGQSYLDYTGSGVYQASQVMGRCADLLANGYGNAHSRNPSADLTDSRLTESRTMVLRFFNAPPEDFSTVFTSGATGALKMVGEDFPWTSSSKFFYLRVNHNSVLGIREYAANNKAEFRALSEREIEEILTNRENDIRLSQEMRGRDLNTDNRRNNPYCLFAFPAKDNFCGKLYPLEWVDRVHRVGLSDNCEWRVLLDAAAYAPTHTLDMKKWPADYTAISFYKMIGYPTGLGVLLLKNNDATLFNKLYWGGGSVVAATCDTRWCRKKDNPSLRFEDGTVSFLAIAGIKYGFNKLLEIGMDRISAHISALTVYMAVELDNLQHLIGSHVVERYGDKKPTGGVIAFNILKPDGDYVNFGQVEMQSSEVGIHLRTGCFCNPGACQDYLGLTAADIEEASSSRESCSDPVSNQRRKILGAVRVSVGYLSTFEDVDRFLQFVRQTYVM
eukprot:GHVS01097216.1.p1 GENE.GHVS01097216.1~~GHVS01097216.1.p1  ORF type:complete len:831 (+),score=59.16 GHVS01097216.1:179-2671(+)